MKKLLFLLVFILQICADNCSLFRAYPNLKDKIPYISFCDLPTPVQKLENFGEKIGYNNVYIKRDDQTGRKEVDDNGNFKRLYGGNKARKLEWLLADAKSKNATKIITHGCVGSNHALATTVYSKVLGLNPILMLKPQPNSFVVRQNLMLDFCNGAQMNYFSGNESRDKATKEMLDSNSDLYFVPTGGSNKIGVLGFVNAFFELCEQVESGQAVMPDKIYLPIGSSGTTAGLMLGIALKNSKTKIIAVTVEKEDHEGDFRKTIKKLFEESNDLLISYDSSISKVDFPEDQLVVNQEFAKDYGFWNQDSYLAIKLFKDLENINLEGTYSSNPVTALIDDVAHFRLNGEVVLIWETYCGFNFDNIVRSCAYKNLPEFAHQYFENDVQLIDRLL